MPDMVANDYMRDELTASLIGVGGKFADCSDITVRLIKQPFSAADSSLLLEELTAADFDGYADKVGDAVPAVIFIDPTDGKKKLRIPEPVGGWNWVTSGMTDLPQTISGLVVLDVGMNGAFAVNIPAVALTGTSQGVGIGDLVIPVTDIRLF